MNNRYEGWALGPLWRVILKRHPFFVHENFLGKLTLSILYRHLGCMFRRIFFFGAILLHYLVFCTKVFLLNPVQQVWQNLHRVVTIEMWLTCKNPIKITILYLPSFWTEFQMYHVTYVPGNGSQIFQTNTPSPNTFPIRQIVSEIAPWG